MQNPSPTHYCLTNFERIIFWSKKKDKVKRNPTKHIFFCLIQTYIFFCKATARESSLALEEDDKSEKIVITDIPGENYWIKVCWILGSSWLCALQLFWFMVNCDVLLNQALRTFAGDEVENLGWFSLVGVIVSN